MYIDAIPGYSQGDIDSGDRSLTLVMFNHQYLSEISGQHLTVLACLQDDAPAVPFSFIYKRGNLSWTDKYFSRGISI